MRFVWIAILLTSIALMASCASSPQPTEAPAPAKEDAAQEGPAPEEVRVEAQEAFFLPAATYLSSKEKPVIPAKKLAEDLKNPEAPQSLIIDVREDPAHFAAGHIEGAVHLPLSQWNNEETYEGLPEPGTRLIFVCHHGLDSALLVMLVRERGHVAFALKHGMMAWSSDPAINGQETFCEEGSANYPVVTTEVAPEIYPLPSRPEVDDISKILPEVQNSLISAQALKESIDLGGPEAHFVVDARPTKFYEAGHIEGAVHIPFREILSHLDKLPANRPIALVCSSGHKSSVIVPLLRQLGYEAYSLKYGMAAWTTDPDVVPKKAIPSCKANFPVVTE